MTGSAGGAGFPTSYPDAAAFLFRRGGPRALLAAILLAVVARASLGAFQVWDAVILLLFVGLRGFMEWGLHVYVFHAAPLPLLGIRLHNPISRMHAMHHGQPQAIEWLFFGWRGVLVVLALSGAALLLVFQDVRFCLSGLVAVAINLLLYEGFHLLAHSSITPASSLMRSVVTNHRKHYFVDGDCWMGVSSTIPDKLLGTYRGE